MAERGLEGIYRTPIYGAANLHVEKRKGVEQREALFLASRRNGEGKRNTRKRGLVRKWLYIDLRIEERVEI